MRSIFLLFTVLACNMLHSAEKEFSMPLSTPSQQAPRQVRLQIELSEADVKDYGMQQSTLYTEIATRLSLGQIQIQDDPSLPLLILRIKSIQADRAIATFVQMAFFEDAVLVRNNSNILAMTWSQATMITSSKEDLTKEVSQAMIAMTNAFILDYQKAMVPS